MISSVRGAGGVKALTTAAIRASTGLSPASRADTQRPGSK